MMINVVIKLEEDDRILKALGVNTEEEVRDRLIRFLNTQVNDYEQGIEFQKAVDAYEFKPLTELYE